MITLLQEVENLPVADKVALYNLLQTDRDVNKYLKTQENDPFLFEEISRRDAVFKRGDMKLTTIEELEESLNENDNVSIIH